MVGRLARTLAQGLGGALGLLLLLEALLRLLPVSTATRTGYTLDPLILSYPPQHSFRVATGWDLRNPQTLRANNLGFVDDQDARAQPGQWALIGDSYVESSMLDAPDRPGAQLRRALGPQRPLTVMGAPGSSLLDYAERIRWASQNLAIHDFVLVLEAGDIRQALCGSGNVHGPCLNRQTLAPAVETQAPPSPAKRWLRESALAQYLVGQIRLSPATLFERWRAGGRPAAAAPPPPPPDDPSTPLPDVDAVSQAFFERVRPHATGRLVLVVDFDHDRPALVDARMARERQRFMALARAQGARVVDMAPVYAAHRANSTLALSVGPYDGHLNRLGVGLLVKAAAAAMQ